MKKSRGMKTVKCRTGCGNDMEISEDSVSGMCWRCVNKMMATGIETLSEEEEEVDSEREKFEDE